jgi:glutathione S-transferase
MKFYQLCGIDRSAGFSPYGWRAKLCLLHKGVKFEEVPILFTEKDRIAHADKQTIPVLEDGDNVISDSFAIANYLEAAYTEPSLFGGAAAQAQAAVFNSYLDSKLIPAIFPTVLMDIHACLGETDQAYFRESREARVGMPLEEFHTARHGDVKAFQSALAPFRAGLISQPFLSGEKPLWLDYALMGTLMWPHVVSNFEFISADDPLHDWRERMFDLFGGALRNAQRTAL